VDKVEIGSYFILALSGEIHFLDVTYFQGFLLQIGYAGFTGLLS
jgi:hypothetical protein